jgi:xanthine dehydrogenase YagS FAD-binding subunit
VRAFTLHEPASTQEAVDELHAHGTQARPLAGGTDLVAGVMRDQLVGSGMPYPTHLVDLTTVSELAGIRVADDGVRIGATTTLTDIAASSELSAGWPLLTEAASQVASPEIRNLGTLGGNIHQRPRCWFFRNKDFDCIKKGGDVCFAVKGDNRYNAVIGGHLCYIVHPSDLAMVLVALGARARVASPGGAASREIPFDEYFVGPQQDLLRETVLGPDELLTEVVIPPTPPRTHHAWRKLNEKGQPTWDFALVSVAAAITASDGVWEAGRIVLGGVAPVPYRAKVVEDALAGQDIRSELPDAISELRALARPMSHNAFKLRLMETLIERTVLRALDSPRVVP